jgi:protein TonB
MQRTTSNRIIRGGTAGAVLLLHALLVWIVIETGFLHLENLAPADVVIATLIERPLPRNLSLGPVPVQVKMQNVLRLQRFAPKLPDIPVEAPDSPTIAITLPQPASAHVAPPAETGLAGQTRDSSGHSGGGFARALIQRVVPKYPAASVEREEEGDTAVQLRVDESGSVNEVNVIRSSGSRRLDAAAVQAARKWKFARLPPGSAPNGTWVETELRFVLYRFSYSRLGDSATDSVYTEQVKTGAMDQATPGSQEALARFIADVSAGTLPAGAGNGTRHEVAEIHAALEEWGEVESIHFTGTAGTNRWMAYHVGRNADVAQPTVEVSWNTFEVRHQHATSAWLIAVDRDGVIWHARASRARWL